MIQEILDYNKKFVENKEYERYQSGKYPEKKLAILSCMDTRLTELLPAALGIKDGDAKRNTLTEFNSNNTKLLNLEETKATIAKLAYIQERLAED